jgi:hypothetical protein
MANIRTILTVAVKFILITRCINAQTCFQQEVNYTINVRLNDSNHSIKAYESIQYINNSPDSLKYLYFHLWPNAYKNNSTAFARQMLENGNTDFYFSHDEERGYIDSMEFRVNGIKIKWSLDEDHIDICRLDLNETLSPGDTIEITTPFYVKIPHSFSRLGHDGQSYQITQWYPKPAVYDSHGWNKMPYLDQGEFYSEFGSFDVFITLPGNYVVGATGNLMNKEEYEWLEERCSVLTMKMDFPESDKELKTIRFQEKNIHDFAWFADKRFIVRKGEVELAAGNKVTTWAMFLNDQAYLWENTIQYINNALHYYSDWYGVYPYDNCTAVYASLQTGGAMEYPTITVVGKAGTKTMLEEYIIHEVGHNWFYGILGFNERRYPYLDEGLNTFSVFRYYRKKYPSMNMTELLMTQPFISKALNINHIPLAYYYYLSYLPGARSGVDQPMNLTSEAYTEVNYGSVVYYKSALAFAYLKEYLGENKFNEIMRQFFEDWQFKHPGPEDLRDAFRNYSGSDLSWFFDHLIATTGRLDYGVKQVKENRVKVKNYGQISSPVSLTAIRSDGTKLTNWYPGFTGKEWLDLQTTNAERIVLFDSVGLPEYNLKNNTFRVHGPVRWIEPINLRPIQMLEKPNKTQIGILPAAGWNNYNKTLVGILIYSPFLPQQTLEYELIPMFGTGNHDIAGIGRISLNFSPRMAIIQSLQLSMDARRFGYSAQNGSSYSRLNGEMSIIFRNLSARSQTIKSLKLGLTSDDVIGFRKNARLLESYFLTMDAGYSDLNFLHPYKIGLHVEYNNDFAKAMLELNYTHAFRYAADALSIRIFAGGFIEKENDFNAYYSLRLSGASGSDDYMYKYLFLGRFEKITDPERQDLLSQQFVADEGGFASHNPFAISDKWLVSAGLTARLYKLPLYVFTNAGSYSGGGSKTWVLPDQTMITSHALSYETGITLNLGNFLKVYFPVIVSSDISKVNRAYNGNYWQTIRYIIDFNAINPLKLKDKLF